MSKTGLTQKQSHFANVVHADIKRSTFFRNSTRKTTFNCGDLVPVYVDEVLPGDTFEMDLSFISRLTTPIFPTMDVLNLDFYAFFVPNRLVWDGWEALNGENKNGAWVPATPPALVPMYVNLTIQSKSIGDYYGLPVGLNMGTHNISELPFRGYGLIWNEWFRDQNLQAPIPIAKGGGSMGNQYLYTPDKTSLLKTNKKHDYFTSCLPAPQKGQSSLIPISLRDLIPVGTFEDWHNYSYPRTPLHVERADRGGWGNEVSGLGYGILGVDIDSNKADVFTLYGTPQSAEGGIIPMNLWADPSNVNLTGTTIHELRTAFQIQKLFERDARGGTRYVEMLKAHFGVDAQDYRLQRPEFLGHYHSHVGIQQVAQTSHTTDTSPQGNLAAFSYTAGNRGLFKKSFVEHGFIHIFAVARQPKSYQQGIERMFQRRERLDFYLPVLAHISEQPVYTKEIDYRAPADRIFGYNEAWADYRFKPNKITGQFRSGVTNSLDNWHYGDYYASVPTLSDGWITDNSKENVDRTIAVQSSLHDQIICDIAFKCKATRPMPVYSVPGLVDHF